MDVIDTSTLPGDDMNPETIDAAARSIRGVGTNVSHHGSTVLTAWQKISGSYHAPEESTLFTAMKPVKTDAETFGTDVGKAATALETFAEAVRTIKTAVAGIRTRVETFENKIAADGTVQPKGGYNPYAGGYKLPIQWNEDSGMVDEHNALVKEINGQIDAMLAAEIACANAINDITGMPHVSPNSSPATTPPHLPDAQWYLTAPIDRKEDCGQQIGSAVMVDFIGGGVSGLLSLGGVRFSLTTGKFSDPREVFKETYGGLASLGVGSSPILLAVLRSQGGGAAEYADNAQKTLNSFLADQISIDPYAEDPLERYHDKPVRAWTNNVLNVASWLFPPAKLQAVGKAGKAAEIGNVATKTGEVVRFADAAKLAEALRASGRVSEAAKVLELAETQKALARLGRSVDLDASVPKFEAPHIPPVEVNTGRTGLGGSTHADPPPAREPGGAGPHESPGQPDAHTPRGDGSHADTGAPGAHEPAATGHGPARPTRRPGRCPTTRTATPAGPSTTSTCRPAGSTRSSTPRPSAT